MRQAYTEGTGFGGAARMSVCRAVKGRARAYALRPAALDALHPGLSTAAPRRLVALAEHLVERERSSPRRWFGFGGEIGLINARAALLLGRVERRGLARRPAPDPAAGEDRNPAPERGFARQVDRQADRQPDGRANGMKRG